MVCRVELAAPRTVTVTEQPQEPLSPGTVRVRTVYSGLSAGTELALYRGTNPYLNKRWDAERRLFTAGGVTLGYPVTVWGYSEVGRVVELAQDVADADGLTYAAPAVGDVVWGMWGHRGEAVVSADSVASHGLSPGRDLLDGVFARVGAVALNASLAATPRPTETVAVFGQGVIGLIATQLVAMSGAAVVAVDAVAERLARAAGFGATTVAADVAGGAGAAVRELTGGRGADAAVELSGSTTALHEAIRTVGVDGLVVAAGFYQGEASGLLLGEEFHHNRVRLVASQIGGVPPSLAPRWTPDRLHLAFMQLVERDAVDVRSLVTHVVPAADAADAYALLDRADPQVLQVVLDFGSDIGSDTGSDTGREADR
jgi:2-desacetyl-2-hydroxyethyl bacteriochlorophyllide A dehydrogenase